MKLTLNGNPRSASTGAASSQYATVRMWLYSLIRQRILFGLSRCERGLRSQAKNGRGWEARQSGQINICVVGFSSRVDPSWIVISHHVDRRGRVYGGRNMRVEPSGRGDYPRPCFACFDSNRNTHTPALTSAHPHHSAAAARQSWAGDTSLRTHHSAMAALFAPRCVSAGRSRLTRRDPSLLASRGTCDSPPALGLFGRIGAVDCPELAEGAHGWCAGCECCIWLMCGCDKDVAIVFIVLHGVQEECRAQ